MKKSIAKLLLIGMMVSVAVPGGKTASVNAAKKTTLNKKKMTLTVGGKYRLKVKNKAKSAKVKWKSNKPKIAGVNKKGEVEAKKKGTAKITATVKWGGNKKNKLVCKVAVKDKKPAVTAKPSVSEQPVYSPQPTQPSRPEQTNPATPPAWSPAVTYHPDWPSEYTDGFLPLKDLATGFRVGSAIAGSQERFAAIYDADMRGILQKHYNTTTLTNLMKPALLLDKAGSKASEDGMPVVKFDSCEEELKFCKDTGISLRGHVLVWYNQTPDWFFYEDYDTSKELVGKETIKRRMESYIRQVVTYVQDKYPGVIYCWDVVNEAVDDEGVIRKNNNKWMEVYSEGNDEYDEYEYVKDAFRYARRYTESGVSLVYNDYNTFVPEKRKEIINLIHYVNQEEKLIDAVGMQCPILPEWPYLKAVEDIDRDTDACVEYAIEDFAAQGLEIMITELCVRTDGGNSEREMRTQAARYKEMYELLLDMDTDGGGCANITSVTTFGISDSYRLYPEDTWEPRDESRYAWFFDKNCKAKLAFKCVYNVFAGAAGKPTVPETYEKPEGQEDEKPEHILKGVIKSKNEIPLTGKLLVFVDDTTENMYFADVDENGYYSIALPEGTYRIVHSLFNDNITIRSSDPEVIEKDFISEYNCYHVYGKIISENGVPLSNDYYNVKVVNTEGETIQDHTIATDKNGMFHAVLCEGTAWMDDGVDGKVSFEVSQNIDENDPLEITVSYRMVQFSGTVAEELMTLGGEVWQEAEVDLRNEHTLLALSVENGEISSCTVPEGNYQVSLWLSTGDDEDWEEYKSLHVYYADLNLKEDQTLDIVRENIHELIVTVEPDLGMEDFYLEGGYNRYEIGSPIYMGNVSGRFVGSHIARNEDGTLKGFYEYDVPFALTEQDGERKEIRLELTPMEIPELELGNMTSTTLSDLKSEDMKYGYAGKWYQFTPQESASYTFYSDSGIKLTDDDDRYVFCELSIYDNQLSDDFWFFGLSDWDNVDVSCKVKLEAGKTYYVNVYVGYSEELAETAFPIGVRKD